MDIVNEEEKNKKIDNSSYCIFVILITQIPSACIFGLNLGVLNTASPVIENFINETYTHRYGVVPAQDLVALLLTIAHSSLVVGCLPGSLMVNVILEHLSRKNACLLIHVVNTLSAILMGPIAKYGRSYEALIVGRFFAGFARGLALSIIMVVVAETTCRRKLGYFQSPFPLIAFVSGSMGAALGYRQVFGTPALWQWGLSFSALASLMYICCFPWLPETPVSLIRMGRVDEAMMTLKRLRTGGNEEIELKILQNEISEQSKCKPLSFTEMMKQPHLRLQFFVSIIAMNSVQSLGIQAIVMYSDSTFIQAGVDPRYATYATIGLYLQSIVAFIVFIYLHRKYGTKRIFIAGIIVCVLGYIVFIISHALQHIVSWTSYLAIGGMCIVTFGLQLGPQLCMLSLPAELSTAASRPTVAFYSGFMLWTIASVTAFVFPFSLESWKSMAYVPYPVMGVFVVVFSMYMMPETHNRVTAQIQSSLRRKSMVSSISNPFETGTKSQDLY